MTEVKVNRLTWVCTRQIGSELLTSMRTKCMLPMILTIDSNALSGCQQSRSQGPSYASDLHS